MNDIKFQTDYINHIEQLSIKLDLNQNEKEYLWHIAHGLNYVTFVHCLGVHELVSLIGEEYGLSKSEQKRLQRSAFLHDIGKMQINPDLLSKKKLTANEFRQLKEHVLFAKSILFNSPFEECIPEIIAHHENWDGTGYPYGLKEKEIPFNSRIIRVVDSYNSATTNHGFNEDKLKASQEMMIELDSMRHNEQFIYNQNSKITDRKNWYDGDIVDAFMLTMKKRKKSFR